MSVLKKWFKHLKKEPKNSWENSAKESQSRRHSDTIASPFVESSIYNNPRANRRGSKGRAPQPPPRSASVCNNSSETFWHANRDTEPCQPSAPPPTLPRPPTRRPALPVTPAQNIPNSNANYLDLSPDVDILNSSSLENVLESIRQMNTLYPTLPANHFAVTLLEDESSEIIPPVQREATKVQSGESSSWSCSSCELPYSNDDLYYCINCGLHFCIMCVELNKTENETECHCRRCLVFQIQHLPLVSSVLEQLHPSDLRWYLTQNQIIVNAKLSKQQLMDAIKRFKQGESVDELVNMTPLIDLDLEPDTSDLFAGLERSTSVKIVEMIEDEDENMCKICMDDKVNCALVECGHMMCCEPCGRLLTHCPICRKQVKRVLRIYQA